MKIEYTHNWFSENANTFNKWFDADTFKWHYSHLLPRYCPRYFNIWWNPEKFNWMYSDRLAENLMCGGMEISSIGVIVVF